MFVKGWLFFLLWQLTIHVLATTQQSETHPCPWPALGSGMKHISSRDGITLVLPADRDGDLGFIKTDEAVKTSHQIRTDLAELPILQRLPLIIFLEEMIFNMQNPIIIIPSSHNICISINLRNQVLVNLWKLTTAYVKQHNCNSNNSYTFSLCFML